MKIAMDVFVGIEHHEITIEGDRKAVLLAAGRHHGVTAVVRDCPVHDGDMLVVDSAQADQYTACIGRVIER